MTIVDHLGIAITRLSNNKNPDHTIKLEKELMRWGVQVNIWKNEMTAKLERQFEWLDPKNQDNPNYEKRFTEWSRNLDEYKRACRLLDTAKELM